MQKSQFTETQIVNAIHEHEKGGGWSVNRSRLYYKPVGEKPENLKMMTIMDKHLTDPPTEGVVSLVLFFIARQYPVGPKGIRRLLKIMGRETIYRRKNLTKLGMKEFINHIC